MLLQQDAKSTGAGCYAPVYILMADGGSNAHKTVLRDLWNIKWFKHGIKAAIAIGNDVHFDMLEGFTGTSGTVFRTHTSKRLKDLIKLISLKSSQIASQSASIQSQFAKTPSNVSTSFPNTSANAASELELDKIYSKQEELAKTLQMFMPSEDEDSPENWDW